MKEKINIVPDTSLLPKLGKSGYSIAEAVAELLDNSIDARTVNSKIFITINSELIKINDNGIGMNKQQLTDAMRLAKSDKKDQLGRFGLGLKTSVLSLGESFKINTKSDSEKDIYSIDFDESEWKDGNEWEMNLESFENPNVASFTEIIITKLRNKIHSATVDKIARDIGIRYAPFIVNGEVEIYLNKKKCTPFEPNLIENSKRKIDIDVIYEGRQIGRINGWVGLLSEGSNKGNYGFTTYWMGRMISTYDKIAIGNHPTISRIFGEINLDYLEPTHNKREFIKEDPKYVLTEELLKEDLKDILSEARKKSSSETVTPDVQKYVEKYQEATLHVLNNDDIFKEFTNKNNIEKFKRDDTGDIAEKFDVEKRSEITNEANIDNRKDPFQGSRDPKVSHVALRKGIKIRGEYFQFAHSFQSLGENEKMKVGTKNQETRVIEIFTNTDFPAYSVTKDKSYYAFQNIADYISELYCSEIPNSDTQEIKEIILRKVSEYISEIEV